MVSRSQSRAASTSNGVEKEPDSARSGGAGKTDSPRSKAVGKRLLKTVLTKTSGNRSQNASLQDISNRTDKTSLRNNDSTNLSIDLSSSLDTTGKKRGAALAEFRAFQDQETPRTTMQNFIDVHEESAMTPAAFFPKQKRPSEGGSFIKSASAINASELISDSSNLEQQDFSAADISSDVSSIEAGPSKRRGQRKRKAGITADEMDPGKDITQPLNKSNKTLDITDQVSDNSSLDETVRLPRNKRKNKKKFEPSDFDFSMPLPPPDPKNKSKASNKSRQGGSTKLDISDITDLSMDESMEAVAKVRQRKQFRKKKATQISVADFSVAAPDEEEDVEAKVDEDEDEAGHIPEEIREKTTTIDSSMDESINAVAKIRERKKFRKKKAVEINATEFSVAVPEDDVEEQVEENVEESRDVRPKGEKSKNDDSTFTDLSQLETPVQRKPRVRRRKTEFVEADFSGILTPASTPAVHQEVVVNALSDLADIEKVGEAFKDRGSFNISEAELHKMLTPESGRLVQTNPITTDAIQNEGIINGVSQLGPQNQQIEITGASELSFSRLNSPERGAGRRGRQRTDKTADWVAAFDDIPGPNKTRSDDYPGTANESAQKSTDLSHKSTEGDKNPSNANDSVPRITDPSHKTSEFDNSETTLRSVSGQTQNMEDPVGRSASRLPAEGFSPIADTPSSASQPLVHTLTDEFQINENPQSVPIPHQNSLRSSSRHHDEISTVGQATSEEQNFSLELSTSPPLHQSQNDYKEKSGDLDAINAESAAQIISNEGIDFDEISRLAANSVEPGFEGVVSQVPGDGANRFSDVTDATNDEVNDVVDSTRGVGNRTSDVTNRTSNVTNFDVVTMSPATVRSPTSIMSPGTTVSPSRMSSGTGFYLGTEIPLQAGMSPYRDLEDSDSIVSRPISKSKRRKVQIDVDDFDIDNVEETSQQNDQLERYGSVSKTAVAASDDYENQFKKFLHQDPSQQDEIDGNAMMETGERNKPNDDEYEENSDKIANFEELKARRAARKSEVLGHLVRAPNLSNINEESENPSSRFSTETNGRFSAEPNGRQSTETSSRLSAGDRQTTEYVRSRTATPLSPTKEVNESACSTAQEPNSSEGTSANKEHDFSHKGRVDSGTTEKGMATMDTMKDQDNSKHSVEANVHAVVKSTNENSFQNRPTQELIQEDTAENERQDMTQQNTTQKSIQNMGDSKNRRKSVYQAGLPESQQNLCDDTVYEPGYFVPNVESTRLGNMTGLVDVSPISTPSAPTQRRSVIVREAVDADNGTEEADGVKGDREAEVEDHADGPTSINGDVTKTSQRRSMVSSTAISEKVLSVKAFPEKVSPIHATNNTLHSPASNSTQPLNIVRDEAARNSTLPVTSNGAQERSLTLPSTSNRIRAAENSTLPSSNNNTRVPENSTDNDAQVSNNVKLSTTSNRTAAMSNATLSIERTGSSNNLSTNKGAQAGGNICESSFAPIVNTPSPRSRSKYEPMVASPLIRSNRTIQVSGRRSIDKSTNPLQQNNELDQSSRQVDEKSANRSAINQSTHFSSETAQTQIWENPDVQSLSQRNEESHENYMENVGDEVHSRVEKHVSMSNATLSIERIGPLTGDAERDMRTTNQESQDATRHMSQHCGDAERGVSLANQDCGDAERRVSVSTQDYGDAKGQMSAATQDYEDASVQCYETPEYLRETRRSIKNKSLKHSLYLSKMMEDIAEGGTQTTPTVALERLSLDQIERMRRSVMSETACQVTPSLAANPGLSKTVGHIFSSEVNMRENIMSKSIAACGGDQVVADDIEGLEKSIVACGDEGGVVDHGKADDDVESERSDAIELGETFDDEESEGSEAIGVQPKLSASFHEDTANKWFEHENVASFLKTQEGNARSSFMEVVNNKTSPTVAEMLPSRRANANKDNIAASVSILDKHGREDDECTKGDDSKAESDVDNEIAMGKSRVEHSQVALDTTEEQFSENEAESVIASSGGDQTEAVNVGEKMSSSGENSRVTSEEDKGDNMKPGDGTQSSNENDASRHSLKNVENVVSSKNDGDDNVKYMLTQSGKERYEAIKDIRDHEDLVTVEVNETNEVVTEILESEGQKEPQGVDNPDMCSGNEIDEGGRKLGGLEETQNDERNVDANSSEVLEKLGKTENENLRESEDYSNNEGEQFEDNDTQEVPVEDNDTQEAPVEDNDTQEVAERNQLNKKDKLMRQATLDRYIGVQDKTADVGISQLVTPSVAPGPSKAKKPPRKKPPPAPKTVFPAKNIKFDFQRFSRYKVKKDAEETLCNASQDFMDMVMARLKAIVQKRGASKIHLCDIKQVMVECGFIPKNDDRNLELYNKLRKTTRQDVWMELIPRAVGDGSVYPPQDCWEDTGLTKKRKRKSKSSGSSQEDEPVPRKKKTSASNVKRFKVPRPSEKVVSKSKKQSEDKEAVYSKNGGKGRKSRK